jgi:integrase
VRRILGCVRLPVYRACLTTIYVCGLRLLEGAHLQVADVDSARALLHIHGKGRRDRYVPLPGDALTLLRAHWRTLRSPQWLFPAPVREGTRYFRPRRRRSDFAFELAVGVRPRAPAERGTNERTRTRCGIPTPPTSWKTG